jgi:YVTN family beta-propeller protein
VSVINGATCNATVTTGCGKVPPTVTIGNSSNLEGLAVDQATNTIYAVNSGDDTVSVINGATCNGHHTSGCGQTPKQVPIGRQGINSVGGFVAVDQATHLVYVSDNMDATVSVINGKTCNTENTTGCGKVPPTVSAGGGPAGLAVDPATHTLYLDNNGTGQVSFFRFQPPQRPTGLVATAHHGKADLRWRRAYAGGLPIIYQVIPTPACPACRGLTTPSTSGLPFTSVTGLTPGKTYTFKVKGTDAAGTGPASAASNPIRP